MSSRYTFFLTDADRDDQTIGWEITHRSGARWSGRLIIEDCDDCRGKIVTSIQFTYPQSANVALPHKAMTLMQQRLASLIKKSVKHAIKHPEWFTV